MYKDLIKYYEDNEFDKRGYDPYDYLGSLRNDTPNEELIGEIENVFNDSEVLKDLDTGIIKDMFLYYTKHRK